jgi:hypothetical protein
MTAHTLYDGLAGTGCLRITACLTVTASTLKPARWVVQFERWSQNRTQGERLILQWTENMPPGEGCGYDHCIAETPFGRFLISWKGWKEFDSPTVDETPWGNWHKAFNSVDEAKAACQKEVNERFARWGRPATPPTQPSDYIDPEHHGEDLELLRVFYQACQAEGGTADEIYLKGIRAVLAACPDTPPAPEPGEVAELVAWLRNRDRWTQLTDAQVDRAATLLAQQAAPAPAVVPLRLCERLPDPRPESEGGDCDEEGKFWVIMPRSATPFPNWTLLWKGHLRPYHSHWLPASAIPTPSNYIRDQKSIRPDSCSLPQAGEVEG